MRKLFVFLFVLFFTNSCIDSFEDKKESCSKSYLELDNWYNKRIWSCGDNIECKTAILKLYLEKYADIDKDCKKYI
jgi:hypothetical protein